MYIRFQKRIVSEQVGDVQADVAELTEYCEKCEFFRPKSTHAINNSGSKSRETGVKNDGLCT